jgi:hypothetical protein
MKLRMNERLQTLWQSLRTWTPESVALTALFVFSFCAALLVGAAMPVYTQWTGGLPMGPIVLPMAVMGATAAFVLGRYAARFCGNRVCAGLAIAGAVIAFMAFGDTVQTVDAWRLLALKIGLEYGTWHQFTYRAGLLWFGWAAVLLPFLWVRFQLPRAKLTLFVGLCCGLIVARIFNERLPTLWLYDVTLAGVLLSAAALATAVCQTRWTRLAMGVVGVVLLVGWYFGMQRSTADLLRDVHPFAPIAARDGVYTGEKQEGFTFKEGRVIRTEGLDLASQTASQLIPTLFFPAETARIAVRSQTGSAVLEGVETGTLKAIRRPVTIALRSPTVWCLFITIREMYSTRTHAPTETADTIRVL